MRKARWQTRLIRDAEGVWRCDPEVCYGERGRVAQIGRMGASRGFEGKWVSRPLRADMEVEKCRSHKCAVGRK